MNKVSIIKFVGIATVVAALVVYLFFALSAGHSHEDIAGAGQTGNAFSSHYHGCHQHTGNYHCH